MGCILTSHRKDWMARALLGVHASPEAAPVRSRCISKRTLEGGSKSEPTGPLHAWNRTTRRRRERRSLDPPLAPRGEGPGERSGARGESGDAAHPARAREV